MATFKQGILGGFSGKVGGVIGSSWKGINTMRSQPASVLNPRTTSQVNNRNRFGSLSTLAADMLTTIVKPLNDRFAQKMSGYNSFTSRSSKAFDSAGNFVPNELKISSGKLGDPVISDVSEEDSKTVSVYFPSVPVGSYEGLLDKAYIVIIDVQGIMLGTSSGDEPRESGVASVTINRNLEIGETIHAYLSFIRQDGTIVSNSAHEAHVVTG